MLRVARTKACCGAAGAADDGGRPAVEAARPLSARMFTTAGLPALCMSEMIVCASEWNCMVGMERYAPAGKGGLGPQALGQDAEWKRMLFMNSARWGRDGGDSEREGTWLWAGRDRTH